MNYKLRSNKNGITNKFMHKFMHKFMQPTYYNYIKHMNDRFGIDAMNVIIKKTRTHYTNIWGNDEDKKIRIIFILLLKEHFYSIFPKGLFNIHDEVLNYFTDDYNFYGYAEWYNIFYDILRDAEYQICDLNNTQRTDTFREFINKFDTLYNTAIDELYKKKKKFIHSAVVMAKVKHVRSLHLFINRYYYEIFSFKCIPLLNNIYTNRDKHINDITSFIIPSYDFDKEQRNYLLLTLTTIKKGPFGMSHFIGCVLNRLFYKDIALYICDFI